MSIVSIQMVGYVFVRLAGFKVLVNWPTIAKGNSKTPFSIVIAPQCRGGYFSFPWIVALIFDPNLIILSVKEGGIKYLFWIFIMTWPRIEAPLFRTIGEYSNHYANEPVPYWFILYWNQFNIVCFLFYIVEKFKFTIILNW